MTIRAEHVVPYIGNESSGPAGSVPNLCSTLLEQKVHVRLHVLAPVPERGFDIEVREYPWHLLPYKRLGISPEMKRGLREAAESADILHNHSLWMMPNLYPAKAVRGNDCRLVVSPRGTLSKWTLSRSRWVKQIIWAMGQKNVLESADCFVATANSEYHDIRALGLQAPVAVIPNGIDIPEILPEQKSNGSRRRLLFLSRIHAKKGVDLLIRAWVQIQDRFPDWELNIVGPLNGKYPRQMQSLAESLGAERITFQGELCGQDKSNAYVSSDLFVLPTHSENFGMVVAEALAHGTPAVVTKGAPWEGLEAYSCGWWIDVGVGPLVKCLKEAMSKPQETLSEMGRQGREWMRRDYSWSKIGAMTIKTYEWLLGGGTPPVCVRLD